MHRKLRKYYSVKIPSSDRQFRTHTCLKTLHLTSERNSIKKHLKILGLLWHLLEKCFVWKHKNWSAAEIQEWTSTSIPQKMAYFFKKYTVLCFILTYFIYNYIVTNVFTHSYRFIFTNRYAFYIYIHFYYILLNQSHLEMTGFLKLLSELHIFRTICNPVLEFS